MIDHSPDGIYIHVDDTIMFANPTVARWFGFQNPDDMVGRSDLSLYIQEDQERIVELRRQYDDETRPIWHKLRCLRADGSQFVVETLGLHLLWNNSAARLIVVRDLTERLATEQQLYHAQRMDALGKMTGGIAHEFNNFLTVISGFAHMAQRDPSDAKRVASCLAEVMKATKVASALTQRMLAFGRKNEAAFEIVSIGGQLADVRSMLTPMLGDKVRLRVEANDDGAQVQIDRHQFTQAVLNMAINAMHAMPDGGDLSIVCAVTELDQAAARRNPDAKPGRYVVTSVSDTGTGIEPDVLGHIFEPFFTTKKSAEGTGLGLSVVYGLVKAAGGFIDVESTMGEGTCFRIFLPEVESARREPAVPEAVRRRGVGCGTILVAEDKPSVLALAQMALEEAGYDVVPAANGRDALAAFEAAPDRIDLLLTDVAMPEMNGPELADRLRARHADLKVVFMSGHAEFDDAGDLASTAGPCSCPSRSIPTICAPRSAPCSYAGDGRQVRCALAAQPGEPRRRGDTL
ncbi:MAG: ATP-binding protein [Alphaproteobacteria bacterium]